MHTSMESRIKCVDGISRQVFPRLYTYATDYPEKYVNLPVTIHI
jgi:hypothetical protein